MFLGFFYALRAAGIGVSTTEWLALMESLARGYAHASLETFYELARALLVKREAQYDVYDQVFASVFKGVPARFDVDDELLKWLENPLLPRELHCTRVHGVPGSASIVHFDDGGATTPPTCGVHVHVPAKALRNAFSAAAASSITARAPTDRRSDPGRRRRRRRNASSPA